MHFAALFRRQSAEYGAQPLAFGDHFAARNKQRDEPVHQYGEQDTVGDFQVLLVGGWKKGRLQQDPQVRVADHNFDYDRKGIVDRQSN